MLGFDPWTFYVAGFTASMLWVLAVMCVKPLEVGGFIVAIITAIFWPIALPIVCIWGLIRGNR